MSQPLRIAQIGLGPIGRAMIDHITARPALKLVAAVDINPNLIGTRITGVTVTEKLTVDADVAVVTTVSALDKCEPTLLAMIERGCHIVSTCEELSYPWKTQPAIAKRIDDAAKAAGVAVLGTGVNPGYLMDALPIVLTAPCKRVDAIRVERYQDAGKRREPFQRKVGAGMTTDAFDAHVALGKIRHVGLTESMHMIADRMGWTLTKTEDVIEPAIADREMTTEFLTVKQGDAAGVHQVGRAWVDDRLVIDLIFHAAVGTENPRERVVITGDPNIESNIPGGIHGDAATCNVVMSCTGLIPTARPGLRTMADFPLPSVCQAAAE